MNRKYLLPLAAVLGLVIIVVAIFLDNRPEPGPSSAIQWPKVPFESYVAGAGTVESSGGNILVGAPAQGIVIAVYVQWGDRVSVGDKLFKIDDRELVAQRLPALAAAQEANARVLQSRDLLRLAESVPDQRALSREELTNRRSALSIAEAALVSAKTRQEQISLAVDRLTVRALSPGKILQINVHPGEYVQGGGQAKPVMLLGNDQQLQVRVDVDEFDAYRVASGATAAAFARGAPDRSIALKFERIEPYVVPKNAMTGSPTERVDSRVLQVIYSVEASALPVYIGQQLDVYIQTGADPLKTKSSPAAADTDQPGKTP
jgi:HlyD family secretion protein